MNTRYADPMSGMAQCENLLSSDSQSKCPIRPGDCFSTDIFNQGFGSIKITCWDGEMTSVPCFPSSSQVVRRDGSHVNIGTLCEGDEILAALPDGTLAFDTVSMFSLADRTTSAPFVTISTHGSLGSSTLSLTARHHVPVGSSCCSSLQMAQDVQVGTVVWIAAPNRTLVQQRVTHISVRMAEGLHNPLLLRGGFPIVDGVVTSHNTIGMVRFDALVVPWVAAACRATSSCDLLRRTVVAAECAAIRAKELFVGARASRCKQFHYVDGLSVDGNREVNARSMSAVSLLSMMLLLSQGAAALARKRWQCAEARWFRGAHARAFLGDA